ncbi:LuxR C-terminal-related transcriptional regulator [Rhizobium sp. YTU87027]|uniref:response regulator transcription factor n=1 Tax=Rhizobium sp. YTU87027 TaxID=3417741 RepID=UPI003D69ED26
MGEEVIDYTQNMLRASKILAAISAEDQVPFPRVKSASVDYLALIDRRMLERECLAHALNVYRLGMKVMTFADLTALQEAQGDAGMPRAILFNAGNASLENSRLKTEMRELVAATTPTPVVVVSENQNLSDVLNAIALGVQGYIPSSVGIGVCVQAIGLAMAGGKFVPASSVMHMRALLGVNSTVSTKSRFTERQSAVAEALRRGMANKDIALELDLSESTVKVHIRNIMKKLGATNRTEVACKIGGVGDGDRPT